MIKFIKINNTHVLRVLYETNSPNGYKDRIVEYKGDILFYTDILKNKDDIEIELKRLRDNKFLSRNPQMKKKLIIYYKDILSRIILFERDKKIYDLLDRENHINSLILAC